MENHFFLGFADELMKVAGGAKAQYDASGKFIGFKSAYTPQKAPPPPKFKPGSGYKPFSTKGQKGGFETGKSVVKGKSSGLVGGASGQRKALRREGVYGM